MANGEEKEEKKFLFDKPVKELAGSVVGKVFNPNRFGAGSATGEPVVQPVPRRVNVIEAGETPVIGAAMAAEPPKTTVATDENAVRSQELINQRAVGDSTVSKVTSGITGETLPQIGYAPQEAEASAKGFYGLADKVMKSPAYMGSKSFQDRFQAQTNNLVSMFGQIFEKFGDQLSDIEYENRRDPNAPGGFITLVKRKSGLANLVTGLGELSADLERRGLVFDAAVLGNVANILNQRVATEGGLGQAAIGAKQRAEEAKFEQQGKADEARRKRVLDAATQIATKTTLPGQQISDETWRKALDQAEEAERRTDKEELVPNKSTKYIDGKLHVWTGDRWALIEGATQQ